MTRTTIKALSCAAFAALLWLAPGVASAQNFKQTNLVSDLSTVGAATVDPTLRNAWGVARSATGPFWVNSTGNGTSNLYDGAGQIYQEQPQITIPNPNGGTSRPTGIAFNNLGGFNLVANNPATGSTFLFDTIGGTIAGWNQQVNATTAVTKVNESAQGAQFFGLTLIQRAGGPVLLAANFPAGTVEAFDQNFNKLANFTTSPTAGFGPYNVQAVGATVVVAFAKQNPGQVGPANTPGAGFVTVFDLNGNVLVNLATGNFLNAPWGIALAPRDFGLFSNALLIGNRFSGTIDAFNFLTGDFLGTLNDANNNPIVNSGLWALTTGNGFEAGSPNTLFFAAGPNNYKDGLFGTITPILP